VLDIVYLAVVLAFFLVAVLFVRACALVIGSASGEHRER